MLEKSWYLSAPHSVLAGCATGYAQNGAGGSECLPLALCSLDHSQALKKSKKTNDFENDTRTPFIPFDLILTKILNISEFRENCTPG